MFGVVLFVLGTAITFFPGSEQGWFTVAGAFVSAGFFVPRWYVRAAACLIVTICVFAALEGHRRGMEYRRHMEQVHEPAGFPMNSRR